MKRRLASFPTPVELGPEFLARPLRDGDHGARLSLCVPGLGDGCKWYSARRDLKLAGACELK